MKTQWYSGFYVIDALLHRSKGRWSARELLYSMWRIHDSMGFEQLRFVPLFFFLMVQTTCKAPGYSWPGLCIPAGKSRLYDLSLRRVPVSISTDCMHNIRGLIMKIFNKGSWSCFVFKDRKKAPPTSFLITYYIEAIPGGRGSPTWAISHNIIILHSIIYCYITF